MVKPEDALRTPETIGRKDVRADGLHTLEQCHRALDGIRLADSVPSSVSILIETAKNLSLYAYFVHGFHAVAALVGYIALEAALREKWQATYGAPPDERHKSLDPLLKHGLDHGWIRIQFSTWVRSNAEYNAKVRALNALYEQSPSGGFEPPVIEESAIQHEIESMSGWVREWAEKAREARNAQAHGDLAIDDQSEGRLRLIVDAINGMFQGSTR